MTEGRTSISNATTIEEIGEFWDTHEITDYLDQMPVVHFEFAKKPRRTVSMTERFAKELEPIATEKGLSLNQLVNLWLREKLAETDRKSVV